MMVFIKIVITFAVVNSAFCFEANILFHLKSIEKCSTVVSATYNIYQLKDIPFNIFDYIKMTMVEIVNTRSHAPRAHSLLINYNNQVFNKTTNGMQYEKDSVTKKHFTTLEYDFGDVLDMVFKCKNYSNTYVSKFFYLKSEPDESAKSLNLDNPTVPFMKKNYILWVITRKAHPKFVNEINYENFLEDCHQNSHNHVLLILILMLVLFVVGIIVSSFYRFLRKRKILPM